MKKSIWFALWGGMFVLCAGLGFIPEPDGAVKWLLVALSVLCFLPPMVLSHQAAKAGDVAILRLIRNLCITSLSLTVLILIGNFLSISASEAAGNALYAMLVVISAPMVCGQYWLLSLFMWAFLMFDCIQKLHTLQKA